jgi:hypothetical protein
VDLTKLTTSDLVAELAIELERRGAVREGSPSMGLQSLTHDGITVTIEY